MKLNDNLKKKISDYSALATCVLAGSSSALAQTVYHDVDPDFVVDNYWGSYSDGALDINFDGVNDFQFALSSDSYGCCDFVNVFSINPLAGNLVNYAMSYDTFYSGICGTWYISEMVVPKLNMGDTISDADQFTEETAFLRHQNWAYSCEPEYHFGAWVGIVSDKYIGFKLLEDGEYYAGWMRLSVNTTLWGYPRYITVKDYAYQTTPGASIIASDTFDLTTCETPTITEVIATPTAIKIFWDPVDYATNYTIKYRVVGSSVWTKINTGPVTKKKISGLTCNTTYEFNIRAKCEADATVLLSDYSGILTQATPSCRMAGEAISEQVDIWADGSNLFVQFDMQPEQPAALRIFSIQGQLVYSSELSLASNTIQVDVPSGIYVVEVMHNNERTVNKIVIE